MDKKWKYGSKIYVKDGRQNPWIARLNIGYDINGNPVTEVLGSFDDELDCILCLRSYSKEPWDIYIDKKKYNKIVKFIELPSKINIKSEKIVEIDKSNYTFKEVYEEYSKLYFPTKEEIQHEKETHQKAKGKLSTDTMYVRKSSFKDALSLHSIPYANLRTIDFQELVNQSPSPKKAQRLKYLFIELDNYAEQKDIISKSYAKFIKKIDFQVSSQKRTVFTNEEINIIWKDKPTDQNFILVRDILLILLYNGMRIEELLFLFTDNIHLDEHYIIGGLKTDAGKGRIIPLHHLITPIIEKYYNKDNKFLFMKDNKRLDYSKYREWFCAYMKCLGMKHTTHETRHTVESELDRRNANSVTKNLIIGHKNKGTGEDIYTHKSIQELKECIELLTYKETKMIYFVSSN